MQLHRDLGITQKSAWYLAQRIGMAQGLVGNRLRYGELTA